MSRKVYESLVIGGLWLFALTGCSYGTETAAPENIFDTPPEAILPYIELSKAELNWIGQQVFRNECSSKRTCLVHWNAGEAFPSLGIGHFIWYPSDVDGRFVESFPELIRYMSSKRAPIPRWLAHLDPFDAPWPNRSAFLEAAGSSRIEELRAFLDTTRDLQAGFIVQRANDALSRIVLAAPKGQSSSIQQRLEVLLESPGGVYAVIDYVNFKGEGLSPDEQYNGQGWGLLQVLMTMPDDSRPAIDRFRGAAAEVLTRRAKNADSPIELERWLPGWLRRLETYREPH